MAIGLKDIAGDLNVSVSLVSKVLSGRLGTSGASPELANAIRVKAKQLGYHRNRTAAALSSGKHGIIGVFIHRVGARGSGLIEDLIRGIAAAASEHEQRLWLSFFTSDREFKRFRTEFNVGEIDGLIIGGAPHPDLIGDMLATQASGLPIITVHNLCFEPSLVNVGVDQVNLMRMATEHLLDRGCRRLAHIVADSVRLKGFRLAHEQRGLEPDPSLIFSQRGNGPGTAFEYEHGERAARHWLETGVEPDGVVAQSDQQALGAMHVLMRHGVKVPDQVRFIGVDNSSSAESNIVKLTSVSENYFERGAKAVQMLMRAIDGKPIESMDMKPTLHVRASG